MSNIYDKSSLVLIPSGTKTGKVFSQKPVSGDGDFTFTRASAATRVNADGNIEKETSNLLLQSNFSSSWSAPVATMTGGQSGYDGSSDAWLLSATGNFARIEQTNSSSGVVTLSVYAKAGTADWIMLRLTGSGFNDQQYFDLANGSVGINRGCIAADIEDVGGGWYRCSATTSGPTLQYAIMYIALADGNLSPTNENIYIQDAQLEQGLVARDYQETTTAAVYGGITDNTPRLDYTDSSCPALLLEPERTNMLPYSEYLDGVGTKQSVSFSYNQSNSPEAYDNAVKWTPTSGATFSRLFVPFYTGGSQVVSIFAKAGEYDSILLAGYTGSVYANGVFNLSTGTLISSTADDYGIVPMGNGWYRVWIYIAASTNRYANISVGNSTDSITDSAFTISAANGTDSLFVYGFQSEFSASYATSYIPTYGSSVSRVKDSVQKTGVSDLIGQEEGTMFVEIDAKVLEQMSNTSLHRIIMLSNASNSNRVLMNFYIDGSNIRIEYAVVSSGSLQTNMGYTATEGNKVYKIAIAYAANDFVLYVDGVQRGSDTSGSTFSGSTLNQIDLGRDWNGGIASTEANPYKQALVFKTRLTNTELADLTTL